MKKSRLEEIHKLVCDSGSLGITLKEMSESTGLRYKAIRHALQSLKKDKKIFYRINENKWLSIEYQTKNERESMEWTVG